MAFRLFPKEKRLPTILGILILVVGIATTTYLSQRVQQFFLKAEPTMTPQQVKISNVTSRTFTVSWVTSDNPSSGYIKYGKSASLGKFSLDERDQKIDALGQYNVHHVNMDGLDPQATYYFKLVSQGKEYDQNGSPYSVTTLPLNYSSPTLAPTYGLILEENGQPPKEGIVYVTIDGSSPVSALIKSSGNWLVPLSSLSSPDLKTPFEINIDDFEEIFVQGREKTSKAITNLASNAPVPTITLGKDYDFRTTAASSPESPQAGSPAFTPNFSLTQPATDAAIPGQPFFRGTGIPGETVTIKVESKTSLTETITVNGGGDWSWQSPDNLPPGEHTVTVTSTDSEGKLQTIIRKFIILASGTQVTEAATPSATPTITFRPSPTLTPTSTPKTSPTPTSTLIPTPTHIITPTPTPISKLALSPTPQATTAAVPESGEFLLTLILATSGLIFIFLGFFFLKAEAA